MSSLPILEYKEHHCPIGALSLDDHCSDLLIHLSVTYDDKPLHRVETRVVEMLDRPSRTRLLSTAPRLDYILDKVRLGYEPIDLRLPATSGSSSYGMPLRDTLVDSCDHFFLLQPSSLLCLHCYMKNYYSSWKDWFKCTASMDYTDVVLVALYGSKLLNYELSLMYSKVFSLVPEKDPSGKFVGIIGVKDIISFGVIGIDRRYWKVFWLAVRKHNPVLEKKVRFKLDFESSSCGPLSCYKVTLITYISGRPFSRSVLVPHGANIWSGICWLFHSLPKNVETSKTSPCDSYDD